MEIRALFISAQPSLRTSYLFNYLENSTAMKCNNLSLLEQKPGSEHTKISCNVTKKFGN
jgi:hypothetical protein